MWQSLQRGISFSFYLFNFWRLRIPPRNLTPPYLPTSGPYLILTNPHSNADAPTPYTHPDGTTSLVLSKPHEESQPFSTFIDYLIAQERQVEPPTEIRYAQSQDDNLRNEYAILSGGVPHEIPWARIALKVPRADAINLWIGNSHSVSALHHDNYENIYVQISGRKHFVLVPPACVAGVNEQMLPLATYARKEGGGLELGIDRDEANGGKSTSVPFPIWDPDRPTENATRYSSLVEPIRVTLKEGDMLYLPALWCVNPAVDVLEVVEEPEVTDDGVFGHTIGTTRSHRVAAPRGCAFLSTTGEDIVFLSPSPPFFNTLDPDILICVGMIWTSADHCTHWRNLLGQ